MGINIDSLQADTGLSASDLSPASARWWSTARSPPRLPVRGGTNQYRRRRNLDHAHRYRTTWRYNDSRTLTDGNYLYQCG